MLVSEKAANLLARVLFLRISTTFGGENHDGISSPVYNLFLTSVPLSLSGFYPAGS